MDGCMSGLLWRNGTLWQRFQLLQGHLRLLLWNVPLPLLLPWAKQATGSRQLQKLWLSRLGQATDRLHIATRGFKSWHRVWSAEAAEPQHRLRHRRCDCVHGGCRCGHQGGLQQSATGSQPKGPQHAQVKLWLFFSFLSFLTAGFYSITVCMKSGFQDSINGPDLSFWAQSTVVSHQLKHIWSSSSGCCRIHGCLDSPGLFSSYMACNPGSKDLHLNFCTGHILLSCAPVMGDNVCRPTLSVSWSLKRCRWFIMYFFIFIHKCICKQLASG